VKFIYYSQPHKTTTRNYIIQIKSNEIYYQTTKIHRYKERPPTTGKHLKTIIIIIIINCGKVIEFLSDHVVSFTFTECLQTERRITFVLWVCEAKKQSFEQHNKQFENAVSIDSFHTCISEVLPCQLCRSVPAALAGCPRSPAALASQHCYLRLSISVAFVWGSGCAV